MDHPNELSSQDNNFYGVIVLLVVAGLWSATMGSFFGFVVAGALTGILFIRAQWARIVTLVIVGYVGLVAILAALFAHGDSSFRATIFATIASAIFWLLLRPGMERYFSGADLGPSRVVPVAPRPGALPHLQQPRAVARPLASPPAGSGSTQQQWERLQRQLQAERAHEERTQAAEAKQHPSTNRDRFPWIIAILTAFMCSYASSVGGDFSRFIMLLAVPGYIAALARWIPARAFFLTTLVVCGGLIVFALWAFVAPQVRVLLQHHGPMALAAITLLTYLTAVCYSGMADDCESHG